MPVGEIEAQNLRREIQGLPELTRAGLGAPEPHIQGFGLDMVSVGSRLQTPSDPQRTEGGLKEAHGTAARANRCRGFRGPRDGFWVPWGTLGDLCLPPSSV